MSAAKCHKIGIGSLQSRLNPLERARRRPDDAGMERDAIASVVDDRQLRRHGATDSASSDSRPNDRQPQCFDYPRWVDLQVRAAQGSVHSERNVALVLILATSGLFPPEVARLKVRDYLNADGSVREVSELPADVSTNGYARRLLWQSPRTCAAVDEYLDVRRAHGIGVLPRRSYRGLDPSSNLLLNGEGRPFAQGPYKQGERPNSLLSVLKRVGQTSGMAFSVRLVRIELATWLDTRGADRDLVREMLGIRKSTDFLNLLSKSQAARNARTDDVRLGFLLSKVLP